MPLRTEASSRVEGEDRGETSTCREAPPTALFDLNAVFEVEDVVLLSGQSGEKFLFEEKAGMVGGEGNTHRSVDYTPPCPR